jgi:hypothetical protein
MSKAEKNGQGQKPKLCWMAVASSIVVIIGLCTCVVMFALDDVSVLGMCMFLFSIPAGLIFGVIGFYRIYKSQGKKSGRIYATVGILLSILMLEPFLIMRGKTNIASPPRTMQGTIGDAIRAYLVTVECEVGAKTIASAIIRYAEEKGLDANLPADSDFEAIGIKPHQLYGFDFGEYGETSFTKDSIFSFQVHSMNPLRYTITVVNEDIEPSVMTFDQDRIWTEKAE